MAHETYRFEFVDGTAELVAHGSVRYHELLADGHAPTGSVPESDGISDELEAFLAARFGAGLDTTDAAVAAALTDGAQSPAAVESAVQTAITEPGPVKDQLAAEFVPQADLAISDGTTGGKHVVANPVVNAVATTNGTGNTIAGGGATGNPNTIAGANSAGVNTISGGYDHTIDTGGAGANTVAGGGHNEILGADTDHGTIGGGSYNFVRGGHYNTIPGGTLNEIDAGDNNTVGGGATNNIAAGLNSTIAGGNNNNHVSGNAGTISGGSANVTDGGSATVSGGNTNKALGTAPTIGGGVQNEAGASATTRGNYATIGGGFQNKAGNAASANYGTVAGGRGNAVNGDYATVTGGQDNSAGHAHATAGGKGAVTTTAGQWAYASGSFAAAGDHQVSIFQARLATTDATANQIMVPNVVPANSQIVSYRAVLTAVDTATGDASTWEFRGAVRRNGAGTASFVGGTAPTATLIAQDASMSALAANQIVASGQLITRVTGIAAKTIRWAIRYDATEVKYA